MEEDKYLMDVRRGDVRLLAIIGDSKTAGHTPLEGDLVRIGNDLWEVNKAVHLFACSGADVADVVAWYVTTADALYRAFTPKEVA